MQEICFKRTCSLKESVNSRLKTTQIISQRKAFYRQGIPELYEERAADIDILVTSRNGHRKVTESSKFASHRTKCQGSLTQGKIYV